ncbi:hypothetical protein EUGRSUZ_I01317 [Eucalyptus grandis]|uniref:Uncharacterized protein n=1 Tax=Eucalyptus grandis TaxID=71139 RepID=A0ACC3JFC9_EUCGR|nr:hypothetical protein EUGRSUZ_I01317 [Eucalyptus grandis]
MENIQDYTVLFLVWVISFFVVRFILSKSKSSYKLPSSPFRLPIIRHLHLLRPIPHQALHNLSRCYGPLLLSLLRLEMFTTGTGTSAGVIQWALAELINHPDILNKSREETDSTTGNKRLVKESDLPNLHFLQAIVKKTLRLHPSGPLFTRESTQHCKIGGYDIAASTRLIVNVWSIGRDPNYWENPMDFVPTRFINGSGRSQIDVRGRHYELLPFGSGRRSCPWTSLALRVIQTTLVGLIQCFDWKVANGKENSVDMTEAAGIALLMAQPLVCVPVARDIPFLTI